MPGVDLGVKERWIYGTEDHIAEIFRLGVVYVMHS